MSAEDDSSRRAAPANQRHSTEPLVPPIEPAVVYRCEDPQQADALLAGKLSGYVYSRDAHPNADQLADLCRRWHAAPRAVVCGSGMAALAVGALSQLDHGDSIVVGKQLYGRSLQLLTGELARFGMNSRVVDTCDLAAVAQALASPTKLLIVETITNPLLRVPDLHALAELAHEHGALLLVDNTFASPAVCRPIECGADLVVESLTKIMNGHSDVLLGALLGREECWQRVPPVMATWGPTASPFDCWLARRGMGTMSLRVERACSNALRVAEMLEQATPVKTVWYPGLAGHPDHEIAKRQFEGLYGHMVSFTLRGGRSAAERFIAAARKVPFAPSLGDLMTTLSHPQSTSHRAMSEAERTALGIGPGMIRLSLGIEPADEVIEAVQEGLAAVESVGRGQ